MFDNDTLEHLRTFGAAHREAGSKARTQEDWKQLVADIPEMTLAWGECWHQCVVYRVDDFDAEIGFYLGVFGMRPMILTDKHAMFTGPDGDFCVMLQPATADNPATSGSSFTLELMLNDSVAIANTLQSRGAQFDRFPAPEGEGSPLYRGQLTTPNGIPILIWSMAQMEAPVEEATQSA